MELQRYAKRGLTHNPSMLGLPAFAQENARASRSEYHVVQA